MERADWNGFVMGPSILIIFLWDLIQNKGSLFYLLTQTVKAVAYWLIY